MASHLGWMKLSATSAAVRAANRMFSQVMKHNHHGDSRYIDRSTDLGGEQGADLGFLHTRVEHVPQILGQTAGGKGFELRVG